MPLGHFLWPCMPLLTTLICLCMRCGPPHHFVCLWMPLPSTLQTCSNANATNRPDSNSGFQWDDYLFAGKPNGFTTKALAYAVLAFMPLDGPWLQFFWMSISKTRYEASAKSLNISFVKLYWFDPTNKLFREGVPLAFQWWLHTGHILAFPELWKVNSFIRSKTVKTNFTQGKKV